MEFDIHDKLAIVLILAFLLIGTINMSEGLELFLKVLIFIVIVINLVIKLVKNRRRKL
ncbi:hypothetical protein ACUXJ9_001783 [Staphylococcus caledonicus]